MNKYKPLAYLKDIDFSLLKTDFELNVPVGDGEIITVNMPCILNETAVQETFFPEQISLKKRLNGRYKDYHAEAFDAGWNTVIDEKWNGGINFNGDLLYLTITWAKLFSHDTDNLFNSKNIFNHETLHFDDIDNDYIWAGVKCHFIYLSLLSLISEKVNTIINPTQISSSIYLFTEKTLNEIKYNEILIPKGL